MAKLLKFEDAYYQPGCEKLLLVGMCIDTTFVEEATSIQITNTYVFQFNNFTVGNLSYK